MIRKWNEMTIAQYKRAREIPKDEDFIWEFIAVLEGTDKEDIMNRPISETTRLSYEANKFLDKSPNTSKLKWEYELNGHKYKLCAKPYEITTAQYIDFANADQEVPKNLSHLLAIFLIPIDDNGKVRKYNDGYDMEEVEKEFEEHMGIEDALSVANFFSVLFRLYLRRALRMAKKTLRQIKREGSPEMKEKAAEAEKMVNTYKVLLKECQALNGLLV